jgi:cell division protein FtsB
VSRVAKQDHRSSSKQRRSFGPITNGRLIPALLVFVALIILVDGLVGDKGLLAMMHARQEYDELAASVARLRTENLRLREDARRLRDDPAAIEEVARRELGLIRPGEKVFVLKDVAPKRTP